MIKEESVIISNDINIGATIAYQDKKQKRAFVLLIMGTGSLDRDGNSFGFKSNIYKELSDMFVLDMTKEEHINQMEMERQVVYLI